MIFENETKKQIDALLQNLPQSLLLSGAVGAGLLSAAKFVAGAAIAGIIFPTDKNGKNDPRGIIRIEQIRELQQRAQSIAKTKTIFIIDDADKMNHQTQNAFLKLLEEPNPNVHLILTTHHPGLLLPTIRSRVENLQIRPISPNASRALIAKKNLDKTASAQILFLADGRPAEISRLSEDEKSLENIGQIIKDAQKFATSGAYEKFKIAANYTDRERALKLLSAVILLLSKTLQNKKADHAVVAQISRAAEIYDRIAANGNVKLQLAAFIV